MASTVCELTLVTSAQDNVNNNTDATTFSNDSNQTDKAVANNNIQQQQFKNIDPTNIDPNTLDIDENHEFRHHFSTSKATAAYILMIIGQLLIFSAYNICSNIASTIHGKPAMTAMSIVYGCYIFSTFAFPTMLKLVKFRASVIVFLTSLGYILFTAANIYGRIYTLCIGGFFIGCCGMIWPSSNFTTAKVAQWTAERQFLEELQQGKHFENHTPEQQSENKDHAYFQLTDLSNQWQIDWYISTIVDKNNRLIFSQLPDCQKAIFKTMSALQLATYTTISWGVMQGSSIVGALVAFGVLNIGPNPSGMYDSDTYSVRIMYIVFLIITSLGCILYFISYKIMPHRVFLECNKRSKWALFLTELVQKQNQQAYSGLNHNGDQLNTFISQPHPNLPGKALNDSTNDEGQLPPPVNVIKSFGRSLTLLYRLIQDPAIILLLFPYLCAYAPLSFTLSAFSSKCLKLKIGVLYVPIFILIVAASDVFASFIGKFIVKDLKTARIGSLVGLALQCLAVIFMYAFDPMSWTKNEAWKYGVIIGILIGFGDAFSVSGLSTISSILSRAESEVLASVGSLSTMMRGLSLIIMFALTATQDFVPIHWAVVITFIGLSMISHILSAITDLKIDYPRVLGVKPEVFRVASTNFKPPTNPKSPFVSNNGRQTAITINSPKVNPANPITINSPQVNPS